MKVAWHEMPGKRASRNPSRRVQYDGRSMQRIGLRLGPSAIRRSISYRTVLNGTGSRGRAFQAFHANLPYSVSPIHKTATVLKLYFDTLFY